MAIWSFSVKHGSGWADKWRSEANAEPPHPHTQGEGRGGAPAHARWGGGGGGAHPHTRGSPSCRRPLGRSPPPSTACHTLRTHVIYTHYKPSFLESYRVPMTWRMINTKPTARHVIDTCFEPSLFELSGVL